MKSIKISVSVCLLLAFGSASAHAYLDPGTGSMLLQGLIAGIMVVATTLGVYWHRFLDIVYQVTGKDFRKQAAADDDLEEETGENES